MKKLLSLILIIGLVSSFNFWPFWDKTKMFYINQNFINNSNVSAGYGLNFNAFGLLDVNDSIIQNRIVGSCAYGISTVLQNGSAGCANQQGTVFNILSGLFTTGGNITNNGTIDVNMSAVKTNLSDTFYNKTEIDALIPVQYTLYFRNETSDIPNYLIMNVSYPITPTAIFTFSGITNNQSVFNFTSPNNTGYIKINSGEIRAHFHAMKIGGTQNVYMFFKFFVYGDNGTKQPICTSGNSQEITNSMTDIIATCAIQETVMNRTSDRFMTEMYLTTIGGGSAPTIEVHLGDALGCGTDLPLTRLPPGNYANLDSNNTFNGIITAQSVYGELWIENTGLKANSTLNTTGAMAGNVYALQKIDNNYTIMTEQTGAPGFAQVFNFSNGNQDPGAVAWVGYYFPCNPAHVIKFYGWNGTAYENLTAFSTDISCGSSTDNVKVLIQFPKNSTRFNNNGNVSILIQHDSSGSGAHRFGTDYIVTYMKDISFPAAGTYYQLSNLMTGLSNYVSLNASNATMTLQVNGIYKICASTSFRGSPNETVHSDIFANDLEQDKLAFTRRLAAGGDVGSASLCGLYNGTVGDVLSLKFKSDETGGYVVFENGNFNIQRLN